MRENTWRWVRIRIPGDKVPPAWMTAVWSLLFPLRALRYWLGLSHGYDPVTDTWVIHGMRYSDALFREWAAVDMAEQSDWYRFKKNGYGALEIEVVKAKS